MVEPGPPHRPPSSDSTGRMGSLAATVLVLPSHALPFKGLHPRIDQLQAHHAERFAETIEACANAPQSAFELVPVLFKRALDLHQMTFAMGESLAHLHALWFQGKLERTIGAGVPLHPRPHALVRGCLEQTVRVRCGQPLQPHDATLERAPGVVPVGNQAGRILEDSPILQTGCTDPCRHRRGST